MLIDKTQSHGMRLSVQASRVRQLAFLVASLFRSHAVHGLACSYASVDCDCG